MAGLEFDGKKQYKETVHEIIHADRKKIQAERLAHHCTVSPFNVQSRVIYLFKVLV